jgi:hypothetical protein
MIAALAVTENDGWKEMGTYLESFSAILAGVQAIHSPGSARRRRWKSRPAAVAPWVSGLCGETRETEPDLDKAGWGSSTGPLMRPARFERATLSSGGDPEERSTTPDDSSE